VSGGDAVVDDHLLLRVLLGDEPLGLRARRGRVATTGLWYHRLCRALADETVIGTLSRSLGGLDAATARATVCAVIDLPDSIELLSLRSLDWPMAELLTTGVRANLLSLEALAAAKALDAPLCLAQVDENPQLIEAAAIAGVDVRVLAA
jgi:hypothetical protein